jgi:hypothetical protein
MIQEFEPVSEGTPALVKTWETRLAALTDNVITRRENNHNRNIDQI